MSSSISGKWQRHVATLLHLILSIQFASAAASAIDGPLNSDQALASFRLEPGIRIELVAAEPLVVDPVALAFDERGRMYVVEDRGYPTGPKEGNPPAGIVALLEDRDHDGIYEARTVFADGLTFPNGVMPWKGGVFVTCAPDLLYLKDTNGDGKADERRIVFTGFDAKNTSQLRISHPTLALDNWIYITSGLTGGKITSPDHPDRPPLELKTDFRFRPDLSAHEAADGRAQFGLSFDDAGHRFICYNRVHIQHVVLPSSYLRRNRHLPFSDTVQNVPEVMSREPLKGHGASARIFPISENVTTADSHAGTFTAACGLLIYRGRALPEEFWGNAFACDPTANLVHRDRLRPVGATFGAKAAREGVEFVASTDNWFRPVNLALGPDGALYICDMYRRTIEHPQYLPEEIRKRTDFISGNDRGRIYRVTAESNRTSDKPHRFDVFSASARELCQQLENPNGWWRDTAQRVIVERQDRDCAPVLRDQFQNPRSATAISRLHAFRALEGIEALDNQIIRDALRDPLPAVREHALQLSEARLKSANGGVNWVGALLPLAMDPDARVRFQCALTLGAVQHPTVIPALVGIAIRDADDRWARAAVLTSVSGLEREFLRKLLSVIGSSDSASTHALLFELGRVIGARETTEQLRNVVSEALVSHERLHRESERSLLNGIVAGGRSRGFGKSRFRILDLDAMETAVDPKVQQRLSELLEQSRADALDGTQPVAARLSAVLFLEQADFSTAGDVLLRLLELKHPIELQTAALRALGQAPDREIAAKLLNAERWAQFTPALQEVLVASLISNPAHVPNLFSAFETGELPLWAISAAQRNQLLKSRDESVRSRAEKLFKSRVESDRMKVFEELKSALALTADPSRGRLLFRQHCASCHRLDREGVAVGPDLFGIRNQPKEAILLHIVVPELEIVPGFAGYDIQTTDGRELSGLIASETDTSITLRGATGSEEILLRSSIASISASKVSLMPQGFETAMTRQEVADLVAYLKGEGPEGK